MGVSRDVPSLDVAYKLVEYAGRARTKLSTGKILLPGRKQVFRVERDGLADHDVLGRRDEDHPDGRPLLRPVMIDGARCPAGVVSLDAARVHATAERERLPAALRDIQPARSPFLVKTSERLTQDLDALRRQHHS
jgi:nicotinate phosphoribosyltransferase